MGYALAQVAINMGAKVTLVSGVTALAPPASATNINATSAEAMYQAVMANISMQDIFISVAAVADYTPINPKTQKIKKQAAALNIELHPNKDILAEVASLPNAPFCVGFAAETQDLIKLAEQKRITKKLPLLVANLVRESMGLDDASITLLDHTGAYQLPPANKRILAAKILTHISQLI